MDFEMFMARAGSATDHVEERKVQCCIILRLASHGVESCSVITFFTIWHPYVISIYFLLFAALRLELPQPKMIGVIFLLTSILNLYLHAKLYFGIQSQ